MKPFVVGCVEAFIAISFASWLFGVWDLRLWTFYVVVSFTALVGNTVLVLWK
jgi:hypothetical protein